MTKLTSIAFLASVMAFAACSQEKGDVVAKTPDQSGYGQQAPNNTGVNERDRAEGMPTPMDQGQSEVDITITQRIRQTLMADDSFSLDAKNIKVIALERAVALRGPVASESEKARIGQIAETTPDVIKVFNMLEVKAPVTH